MGKEGEGEKTFRPRCGLHVSIAGGLPKAVARAVERGCDCFQIFIGNPRSWGERLTSDEEVAAFREARKKAGLSPLVVHLTYLPNLASPYPSEWKRSFKRFLSEWGDACRIGADFFVLHPGSSCGGSHTHAFPRVAKALREALAQPSGEGPTILLENPVGSGSTIGSMPEELGAIAALTEGGDRIGVCLDTAHAFQTGSVVTSPGGMRATLDRFVKAFGRNPIRLLHVNDSATPQGSSCDRHAHIGEGEIGREGFLRIFSLAAIRRLPMILETPVESDEDDLRNLRVLRELLAEAERG